MVKLSYTHYNLFMQSRADKLQHIIVELAKLNTSDLRFLCREMKKTIKKLNVEKKAKDFQTIKTKFPVGTAVTYRKFERDKTTRKWKIVPQIGVVKWIPEKSLQSSRVYVQRLSTNTCEYVDFKKLKTLEDLTLLENHSSETIDT